MNGEHDYAEADHTVTCRVDGRLFYHAEEFGEGEWCSCMVPDEADLVTRQWEEGAISE